MDNQTTVENLLDPDYKALYHYSIASETMEAFWAEEAKQIVWYKSPSIILDKSNPPFARWFPDGTLNMCYNCLDKHIEEGYGDTKALIVESCYGQPVQSLTYKEMYIEVNKLSSVLLNKGVKRGDKVIIYSPLIPQAFVAMMACWRIGAIHIVVFGGFAAGELANRIYECKPKIIITASAGIEPRKKVNYMKCINDAFDALELLSFNTKIDIILYQRKTVQLVSNEDITQMTQKHTKFDLHIYDYDTEVNAVDSNVKVECEEMNANDIMYILYTSGTTSMGKGVVRDIGGTAVTANFAMSKIMNLNRGEVSLNTSDIGWIVGHLFMVYGVFIRGATSLILEGKPSGTPNCEVCFNLIQKYKAKIYYNCPTVLRLYKLEDPDFKVISKYDLSSLETWAISGERCDKATFEWTMKMLGNDKMINDHWWQTESGYPICCNNINIKRLPVLPGVTGYPMLGFDVKLYNDKKEAFIYNTYKKGLVYVKYPTPPSFMTTFFEHDDTFKEKFVYINNEFYYNTGDYAEWTDNGGIHVLSRNDDLMKVAGHRLSSGRIEEVICKLEEVNQCGVVGINDKIKGESPFAFCVMNHNVNLNVKDLTTKCNNIITSEIGAISRIKAAIIVEDLPKNKSGKILRSILKLICNSLPLELPASLDNPEVVDKINDAYLQFKNNSK